MKTDTKKKYRQKAEGKHKRKKEKPNELIKK